MQWEEWKNLRKGWLKKRNLEKRKELSNMPEIESLKKEYEEILKQLSDPELVSNWGRFEILQKRKAVLDEIFEKEREIEEVKNKIEENKAIIAAKEDEELISLAETEIFQLQEKEKFLGKKLEDLLKDKKESKSQSFLKEDSPQKESNLDNTAVIIEIRAGTGGEEAALFVKDLFRMYSKYALNQDWKQKTLDSNPTGMGGFKEIIFELSDGNVFSKIKYEGGVHRVQRIPETEKSGRIHTSTASVAILPKPKKTEIKIRPDDLKIDFYCSSGPGGQYVNKRKTAVRITHLPSGTVVTSQTERNQLQNKENALAILEARIMEKTIRLEEEKVSNKRKTQIGWAKRAEKIRTYNFPQNRLTDHRIKKSWHDLEKIINGNLEPIITALKKEET